MPSAYVLMRCEEGAECRILRDLSGTAMIKEIQPTIGHYDLIAKITSTDLEHMNKVIEELHRDDKVLATKVLRMSE